MYIVTCVYNTLSRWARRLKAMRREFQTALLMTLIPLSVVLVLEASHSNTFFGMITLDIAGVALFIVAMWLWMRTFSQIKIDEAEKHKENQHVIAILEAIATKMGVDVDKLNNERIENDKN